MSRPGPKITKKTTAPKPPSGPRSGGRLQQALDETARREIEAALQETGGQIGAAAKALGVSRVGLWKRMKALGLRGPE